MNWDDLQLMDKDDLDKEEGQRLPAAEDDLTQKNILLPKPDIDPGREPDPGRAYTDDEKWFFLHFWNDEKLPLAPEWVAGAYRRFLDELCAADDRDALIKKAYACYGYGNAVYGQDWEASTACLLRAMQLQSDADIANTLGYMYYYGRVNGGVPQYDKAFYYFSIGAAGGVRESRYKLSDMFRHGYHVPKDPAIAARIVTELYEEQLKDFCEGWRGSDFADVALRMGNLCRYGIGRKADADAAYAYYLQARFALDERRRYDDFYGDDKVSAGIDRAIREILPETSYTKPRQTVSVDVGKLLSDSLITGRRMEMTVREAEGGRLKLTFRLIPFAYERSQPKLLLTIPEAGFCGRRDHITVTVDSIRIGGASPADRYEFDRIGWDEFSLYGAFVFAIDTEGTVRIRKSPGWTAPRGSDLRGAD